MTDDRPRDDPTESRPDIVAATRGGDSSRAMEGEADPSTALLGDAIFWRDIYEELLTMEESVLKRVRELMQRQSRPAQREIELTNLPVIVSQVERFRARLGYWEGRVQALQAAP